MLTSLIEGAERVPIEAQWYACRTRNQHERILQRQIKDRYLPVESFLPTYSSQRTWHDRNKILNLPLIPGYLFVRCGSTALSCASRLVGFAGWISFQGKPSIIPSVQMEWLRHAVEMKAEPEANVRVVEGQTVRMLRGPLAGVVGTVQRIKAHCRLILNPVTCMSGALSVEVSALDCEVLDE